MKQKQAVIGWAALALAATVANGAADAKGAMSEAYWKIWNPEIQSRIDADIRKNRMADAAVTLPGVPAGAEVAVEQLSHDFLFGGNIFLFGDLKTPEKNRRYEETFGALFNAATVAFYWKTLEPERGKPRYTADSPYVYRRPPTDPVVAFCDSKGINMNGHAIIYGQPQWGPPEWLPQNRKAMEPIFEQHVKELAERYGSRVQRWDVVNESIDQANRALVPDDYMFKAYFWAMKYFPPSVRFNSNDNNIYAPIAMHRRYVEIVRNLIDRGIRIDTVGVQMHIYSPKTAADIANGKEFMTPKQNELALECLSGAERPVHISEVTVCAPDATEAGQAIQAEITRNLYRLWFGFPTVMGITWWNVVDGGAAPGEPSFSGLYDKEMNPKPAYRALDRLINGEWRTRLTLAAGEGGRVAFRGFKGKYRATWLDASGAEKSAEFHLSKDGDGLP
jgi:GH35 family endo-1,4-beta-xylanase